MFTLLTTLVSFLAGNTPKFLEFFQNKSDQKHELALAQLQIQQQLELQKAGYVAQRELEQIKFEELKLTDESERYLARIDDVKDARNNDTESARGASTWVINIRALVRPAITFGLFIIFLGIEVFGCVYAYRMNVDYQTALEILWNKETQIVWASIIGFYFGTR